MEKEWKNREEEKNQLFMLFKSQDSKTRKNQFHIFK